MCEDFIPASFGTVVTSRLLFEDLCSEDAFIDAI